MYCAITCIVGPHNDGISMWIQESMYVVCNKMAQQNKSSCDHPCRLAHRNDSFMVCR